MTNKRIPIGSIIAFWGTLEKINNMKRYELCDGEQVTTRGPLQGSKKPNLRGLFIRGVPEDSDIDVEQPTLGGSDTVEKRLTSGTSLTVDHMPSHSHPINDPGHSHSINVPGNAGNIYDSGGDRQAASFYSPGVTRTGGEPTNISIGNKGNGAEHTHDVALHDNRPSFMEVHYIIRVK